MRRLTISINPSPYTCLIQIYSVSTGLRNLLRGKGSITMCVPYGNYFSDLGRGLGLGAERRGGRGCHEVTVRFQNGKQMIRLLLAETQRTCATPAKFSPPRKVIVIGRAG
jgi:hypothetical protein